MVGADAYLETKKKLIQALPKAELHIHVEGSLEPELMLEIAERNGLMDTLKYRTVEELHAAYNFKDLQSFLDLYYAGSTVLLHEKDYYDLAWAYLKKAAANNVVHVEMFFDPQSHTSRGVPWATFMGGLTGALRDAKAELGVDCRLIMCVMRDRGPEDGMKALLESLTYKDDIIGLGMDSTELGNPPIMFKAIYERAKAEGYELVAHCGEEGPPAYIWEALEHLQIRRVDHGVHCLDDAKLVAHLVKEQVPLTVCPLSNLKLKVYDGCLAEKMRELLRSGICVTINSDDPAYFQGYMNANYEFVNEIADLSPAELRGLATNSFKASILTDEEREPYLEMVDVRFSEVVGAGMKTGIATEELEGMAADEGETAPPLEVAAGVLA